MLRVVVLALAVSAVYCMEAAGKSGQMALLSAAGFNQQQASTVQSCKADICFALDSSGSLGNEGWNKVISFTQNIMLYLPVGPQQVKISAVSFNDAVTDQFNFNFPSQSVNGIRTKLGMLTYSAGNTNIGAAMRRCRDFLTQQQYGARYENGVSKIAVIFTDGKSNRGDPVTQVSQELINSGLNYIAVGAGSIDPQELLAVALGQQANVLRVDDVNALQSIVTKIVQRACIDIPMSTTPAPTPPAQCGQWSPFSPCDQPCGRGVQSRYRDCCGVCNPVTVQTRSCNPQPCPVNGGWDSWGMWTPCTATCDGGFQGRVRMCTNPLPQGGGYQCQGPALDLRACGQGSCQVGVNGNWSPWTQWSTCSASCNGGIQGRARYCNNPAPSGGGAPCPGQPSETRSCNTQPCQVAINGNWSPWTQWSVCSATCNGGVQGRVRYCNNPAPSGGGLPCAGQNTQTRSCGQQPCVVSVNGNWGPWGAWSQCTQNCGGTRTRNRQCNNPPRQGNGMDCMGSGFETQQCQQCCTQQTAQHVCFNNDGPVLTCNNNGAMQINSVDVCRDIGLNQCIAAQDKLAALSSQCNGQRNQCYTSNACAGNDIRVVRIGYGCCT